MIYYFSLTIINMKGKVQLSILCPQTCNAGIFSIDNNIVSFEVWLLHSNNAIMK